MLGAKGPQRHRIKRHRAKPQHGHHKTRRKGTLKGHRKRHRKESHRKRRRTGNAEASQKPPQKPPENATAKATGKSHRKKPPEKATEEAPQRHLRRHRRGTSKGTAKRTGKRTAKGYTLQECRRYQMRPIAPYYIAVAVALVYCPGRAAYKGHGATWYIPYYKEHMMTTPVQHTGTA